MKIPKFEKYIKSESMCTMHMRQSLADQVRIATLLPNARPKVSRPSPHAALIPVIQCKQSKHTTADKKTDKTSDKIILISTWGINCGIATYTAHLLHELNKISQDSFKVDPVNNGSLNRHIYGKLVHVQHEFGIIRKPPVTTDKMIITWHTVPNLINSTINRFEKKLNVVAHIIHCEGALSFMNTSKSVYVVNHGSAQIPEMKKEDARKILNINIDIPIGFVFGFQSPGKKYNELIEAAGNANIHIIISGSKHIAGYTSRLSNSKNITFLNRHLTEDEINLYASASDLLLFDYADQKHYSCSGSMHRTIGAGRPVICSNTRHFTDVEHEKNVLKFNNRQELEQCIRYALANSERLGNAAKEYAKETSWENVAKRHIEIYRKYVQI